MKYADPVLSVTGSPYKVTFSPVVSSSGRVMLKETGRVNLYNEIQSHKDSVDIKTLIARFESGDVDVLRRGNGFFADVTNMPKTYADVYQLMINARSHFDALPVDVRRRYDFDFGVYLNSLGEIELRSDETSVSPVSEKKSEESEVKSE